MSQLTIEDIQIYLQINYLNQKELILVLNQYTVINIIKLKKI